MKWMKMPCIKVGGDCLDFKMLDIAYRLSIIEELNLILKSYVPLPTPSISFLATPIFPNSYSILCLNSCLLFILFWLNISHIIWMNRCCLQSKPVFTCYLPFPFLFFLSFLPSLFLFLLYSFKLKIRKIRQFWALTFLLFQNHLECSIPSLFYSALWQLAKKKQLFPSTLRALVSFSFFL